MDTEPLECKEFTIDVPWGVLACQWYGNRNVRPILAVHGWLDNSGTWKPLVPFLPRHIGLLCVDFPGHGRSSKLPKGIINHMGDYMLIIRKIVKTFNWNKVSLLGHSLGGILVSVYASMYPETIDMMIMLDIVKMVNRSPEFQLKAYRNTIEKQFIEDERLDSSTEPPCYTFDEMVDVIHRGSGKSVNKENCKYLMERNCRRSTKDPNKLYFSRDPRVKYYVEYTDQHDYIEDFTKSIRNLNFLLIRSTNTIYIDQGSLDLIEVFKKQNPNFEVYLVEGTHHVHMNSPQAVANIMTPFICKYRPPEDAYNNSDHGLLNSKL